ncbi:hypothetical protein LK462_28170 [Burkholderia vietnamiensis]|nr:hypothetical protein LK462_28170 [Burkholderia vietnamiensis]
MALNMSRTVDSDQIGVLTSTCKLRAEGNWATDRADARRDIHIEKRAAEIGHPSRQNACGKSRVRLLTRFAVAP